MAPSVANAKLFFSEPPLDGTPAYLRFDANYRICDSNHAYGVGHELTIENLRGKEDSVTLDAAGFQLVHHPTIHQTFQDIDKIKSEYYPEITELLKQLTGASRIVIYNHSKYPLRRRQIQTPGDGPQYQRPIPTTHVDNTTDSAIDRVHQHLPASDVPALLKRRFQIINIWRPIRNPAFDWPLALCDYRSINPKTDLFPVNVFTHRTLQEFAVSFNERQEWKYFYGVTPDELILIKCFDSIQDGSVAISAPHGSFEDPHAPEDALPRESIELRALVFYD